MPGGEQSYGCSRVIHGYIRYLHKGSVVLGQFWYVVETDAGRFAKVSWRIRILRGNKGQP